MFTLNLWLGWPNMHIGVSEPRLILGVGSRPWFSLNIHLHRESFGDAALKIHELLENGSWVSILQCPLECDLDIQASGRMFGQVDYVNMWKTENTMCRGRWVFQFIWVEYAWRGVVGNNSKRINWDQMVTGNKIWSLFCSSWEALSILSFSSASLELLLGFKFVGDWF